MEDTQNYLNSILQKRMGSVINHNAASKNIATVTRLPRQEEKLSSMPTVFRKKYETVFRTSTLRGSQTFSSIMPEREETVVEKAVGSNERVEYMAISKRIATKKDNFFISPTVDVTKYQKTNPVPQTVTLKRLRSTSPEYQNSHPVKGTEEMSERDPMEENQRDRTMSRRRPIFRR